MKKKPSESAGSGHTSDQAPMLGADGASFGIAAFTGIVDAPSLTLQVS